MKNITDLKQAIISEVVPVHNLSIAP